MQNFLETSFSCFCGKYISENELGLHVKNCSTYKSESEISKLLSNIKFITMPIDTLIGIRSEIMNYQRIVIAALELEGKSILNFLLTFKKFVIKFLVKKFTILFLFFFRNLEVIIQKIFIILIIN